MPVGQAMQPFNTPFTYLTMPPKPGAHWQEPGEPTNILPVHGIGVQDVMPLATVLVLPVGQVLQLCALFALYVTVP